jgi:RNA polymerase sigma-70 factor, ECF subfamily
VAEGTLTALDEGTFEQLVDAHRHELRVHCYRMLGSFEEAEDLVQETFLRAWRGRADFEGRASLRTWLYRIATNACLDALDRLKRRALPSQLMPASGPEVDLPIATDLAWLQPYPDELLDQVAPGGESPDAMVVARETIEIAYIAALQLLPPKQRATLILRDVLAWSAKDTAALLELSVPSANSALQRARATLKEQLPAQRSDWSATSELTPGQREAVRKFMEAHERSDINALAELLADDVRATMPPFSMWYDNKAAVVALTSVSYDRNSPHYMGEWRTRLVFANRQPAFVSWRRAPGDTVFRAFGIGLLRFDGDLVAEMTSFIDTSMFPAFGLPMELDE